MAHVLYVVLVSGAMSAPCRILHMRHYKYAAFPRCGVKWNTACLRISPRVGHGDSAIIRLSPQSDCRLLPQVSNLPPTPPGNPDPFRAVSSRFPCLNTFSSTNSDRKGSQEGIFKASYHSLHLHPGIARMIGEHLTKTAPIFKTCSGRCVALKKLPIHP